MTEFMTQAAYARKRGVSPPYINKLVKAGVIKLKDKKVDPVQADAAIDAFADPAMVGRFDAEPHDFQKSRAAKEFHVARIRQMEADELEGSLVPVKTVEEEAFRAGRRVRDALMNLPDRLAPVLAAETDARKIHEVLNKELRQALEGLSE